MSYAEDTTGQPPADPFVPRIPTPPVASRSTEAICERLELILDETRALRKSIDALTAALTAKRK